MMLKENEPLPCSTRRHEVNPEGDWTRAFTSRDVMNTMHEKAVMFSNGFRRTFLLRFRRLCISPSFLESLTSSTTASRTNPHDCLADCVLSDALRPGGNWSVHPDFRLILANQRAEFPPDIASFCLYLWNTSKQPRFLHK
jgi:hypothetical protein